MDQVYFIARGMLGIVAILGIAYLASSNKKAVDGNLVASGLILQLILALFILKTDLGVAIFGKLGNAITKILDYASVGGQFVFGVLGKKDVLGRVFGPENAVIFSFSILIPTIILVCVLVAIGYYFGIIQIGRAHV